MSEESPKFVRDHREVPPIVRALTLEDIRARAAATPASTKRRDTLSALDTVARVFAEPLIAHAATPRSVQRLFARKQAAELSLSDKRYANIRSAVLQAVLSHGQNETAVRVKVTLSGEWATLLECIQPALYRTPLRRLASYCSVVGVEPGNITPDVLRGFLCSIEEEGALRNPRRHLICAISHWNLCAKTIPNWPLPSRLSVPDQRAPFMVPWSAFPKSLEEDFKSLIVRLTDNNIFAKKRWRRPLRPATIRNWDVCVRNFASALTRSGVSRGSLRILGDLVPDFETYERGLKVLHARTGKIESSEYLGKQARILLSIAIYHCERPGETLAQMNILCANLEVKYPRQLRQSNREKLRQFDDPKNVRKFLNFPEEEYRRAARAPNSARAAKHDAPSLSRHRTSRSGQTY